MASKKALVRQWLDQHPGKVTEAGWADLVAAVGPGSDEYVRRLLTDSDVGVEAPYGGVRQRGFAELAASLEEFEQAYRRSVAEGNRAKARACRDAVILAKDRAKLAARNPRVDEAKRAIKAEMVEWMLVWLENLDVFAPWLARRRRVLEAEGRWPASDTPDS